jgi:hypothetical protein
VSINGKSTTAQAVRDLTIASGDVVALTKFGSQWLAIGRLYAAAPADPGNPSTPDPTPATRSGVNAFAPVETRSYRNGAWRTDNDNVYQGAFGSGNHTGCAFYGNGPRSLSGATVTSARMVVHRHNGGGITAPQTTTMRLVTERFRPGGAPTLGSSTTGPRLGWNGTDSSFAVPTSWAQSMVDGTAGALGFFVASGSPYVILSGRSEYRPAFTLTISWTR